MGKNDLIVDDLLTSDTLNSLRGELERLDKSRLVDILLNEIIEKRRRELDDEIKELKKKPLILKRNKTTDIIIPSSIFKIKNLSCYEIIVRYLNEVLKLKVSEIAALLKRTNQNISNTLANSRIKSKNIRFFDYTKSPSTAYIELRELDFSKYSVFESLVVYLKDNACLTYSEIAKIVLRDDRTIWSTYNRAKKKVGRKMK